MPVGQKTGSILRLKIRSNSQVWGERRHGKAETDEEPADNDEPTVPIVQLRDGGLCMLPAGWYFECLFPMRVTHLEIGNHFKRSRPRDLAVWRQEDQEKIHGFTGRYCAGKCCLLYDVVPGGLPVVLCSGVLDRKIKSNRSQGKERASGSGESRMSCWNLVRRWVFGRAGMRILGPIVMRKRHCSQYLLR